MRPPAAAYCWSLEMESQKPSIRTRTLEKVTCHAKGGDWIVGFLISRRCIFGGYQKAYCCLAVITASQRVV